MMNNFEMYAKIIILMPRYTCVELIKKYFASHVLLKNKEYKLDRVLPMEPSVKCQIDGNF